LFSRAPLLTRRPFVAELGQRLPQTRGILLAQVHLVTGTVDVEYDGFSGPVASQCRRAG